MPYTNTTLADLQTRLTARTEDQPWWTADDARRALNEGLRIWNLITGMWTAANQAFTVSDDPHVPVIGTILKATRVTLGGRVLLLSSLRALDLAIPNWETATTATGGIHPSEISYWAPIGLTEIMVYPHDPSPTSSQLVVDATRATPILVNGSDYIDLGDEEIASLLDYALHVLSFSKGAAAVQASMPLKVAFFRAAAKKNATFGASSMYRKIIGFDRTRFAKPIELPADPVVIDALKIGSGGGVGS